ncbi:MAG: four helix bundle protein [Pirellulaceae bacterium]
MKFDHEQLDVYRVALEFVGWTFQACQPLSGANRHARDQLLRASQSIPQNIAEGNGKRSTADRRRYFEIARGSAQECAATVDILVVCQGITSEDAASGKELLHRIVSMLSRMTDSSGTSLRGQDRDDSRGQHACDYDETGQRFPG